MIAASEQELVQMTTSGEVYWIPINPNNTAANYGATWSKIALPISLPSTSGTTMDMNADINTTTTVSRSVTSTHTSTTPAATTSTSSAVRGGNFSLLLSIFIVGLGLFGHWSLL
jgi:hypothetical protein